MNKYVAFLRAIDVAGHAKVKMHDLKQAFFAAGCQNVRKLIQSGNVVFEIRAGEEESIKKKKNGGYGFPNNFIEKELGVQTTTRNWSTVSKIVVLLSGTNEK